MAKPKPKSNVLQPKSEIAWQTFNDAIKKYYANLKRYQAETDSKAKERIQDTLRDDGLRIQTFFNEQTRYNTTNTPSAILNPKTGKAGGQWHHAATQNRVLPFFLTVKNKKDFNRLIDALRQYGIATGNSYQNMFDLPIDLHASKNPRAIHRVEEKAGLDEPNRYFKQGGTIDDAIKAVPYLAEDVTGSKRLARDLQYDKMTIGEGSGLSDRVQMTATSESTPEHLKINQEGLQPDLSEQYHKRIAKARQTSLKHVRDRQKGKLKSKTVTDANYEVTHAKQIIGSPDKKTEHPRAGGTKLTPPPKGEAGILKYVGFNQEQVKALLKGGEGAMDILRTIPEPTRRLLKGLPVPIVGAAMSELDVAQRQEDYNRSGNIVDQAQLGIANIGKAGEYLSSYSAAAMPAVAEDPYAVIPAAGMAVGEGIGVVSELANTTIDLGEAVYNSVNNLTNWLKKPERTKN